MACSYNSVIFSTTTANEYFAMAVPSTFLDHPFPPANDSFPMKQALYNMTQLARDDKLLKNDTTECLGIYNQQLVTAYSNVLLVTTNDSDVMPLWYSQSTPTPRAGQSTNVNANAWLCGDSIGECDVDWLTVHPQNWNLTLEAGWNSDPIAQFFVDHCLIQETEAQCTIQFIPGESHVVDSYVAELICAEIMIIVIICNVVKVACFLTAIKVRTFQPLITLGDALASFLRRPEPRTVDLGPLSAADVREAEVRVRVGKIVRAYNGSSANLIEDGIPEDDNPITKLPLRFGRWRTRSKRWFSGASRLRWNLTYFL
jgi:hypothetical protein